MRRDRMNELSKKLVNAVKNDLTPSLGVTEPGAIAYASAAAARAAGGEVKGVLVRLDSGIYKNSFTCAVPGTDGMGCALAAALGAIAGDPSRKLMATEGAGAEDIKRAKELVRLGKARAELASISPEIRIEAEVETELGAARAVIAGRHDRLVSLTVNGVETLEAAEAEGESREGFKVSSVSFDDILECVETAENLGFAAEAVEMDLALFDEGRRAGLMPLTEARHGGSVESVKDRADLITAGAIEARVRGANAPAMAITGSGSHGILCTLPVHEAAVCYGVSAEKRLKALLLSMLVTTYIKENSGLLSTACGCVLAGGTGAALGITYLLSGKADRETLKKRLADALNSMAASVTGMICHGGNTGCSLKASVGVNMAFAAAEMAVSGAGAESVHGILGRTPEETMRNMGRVARDMLPVEKTILEIMSCKERENLLQ
jgi:L-cysteine desulfidase